MGSRSAQLFHEHAFCKEAGTTKATPWHHDLPYYCVDGRQTASVYVALDTIPESIAVRFWRGSHHGDQLYVPCDFAAGAEYDAGDSTMLSVPMSTRRHDPATSSPSTSNPGTPTCSTSGHCTDRGTLRSPARRRAFSTRWLGDDVTYVDRPGETSPPLSDLGMRTGDRMREDWFPVLWTAPT